RGSAVGAAAAEAEHLSCLWDADGGRQILEDHAGLRATLAAGPERVRTGRCRTTGSHVYTSRRCPTSTFCGACGDQRAGSSYVSTYRSAGMTVSHTSTGLSSVVYAVLISRNTGTPGRSCSARASSGN